MWEPRPRRRTAGRVAATTVTAGWPRDAVVLGASIAAGRPFGAAVFAVAPTAPERADGDAPDGLTCAVVDTVLAELTDAPRHERAADAGQRLRTRIDAAAETHAIALEIHGHPALLHVGFAGQENAEPPLMAHHFQLELETAGCRADADLRVPPVDAAALEPIAVAFETAIARIRTLLIEHNSYLSGGIPFVFAGNPPALAARGIARYRHPKLAAVDVDPTPDGAGMRIAFAAGDLGPIVSSGFYLPTRLAGDLDIAVRYAVRTWEPGPDSACLGLFLQNEPSSRRYYAQLMSTADAPSERSVAAGLEGGLGPRRIVSGDGGWLRLTRVGDLVTAWYRPDAKTAWESLGDLATGATDTVICGVKIWSKVSCGGLVVDLFDLTVAAKLPAEQLPELEVRPDPRG